MDRDPIERLLDFWFGPLGDDGVVDEAHRQLWFAPNEEFVRRCVECFEGLCADVSPEQRPLFEDLRDYARRHRAVVERFGRFPHRNAIIGRPSTPGELAFLMGPEAPF